MSLISEAFSLRVRILHAVDHQNMIYLVYLLVCDVEVIRKMMCHLIDLLRTWCLTEPVMLVQTNPLLKKCILDLWVIF